MAVSLAYQILWGTAIVCVILPHLNLGLLSDFKVCGDSECESLMSRVQAIKDHRGKDCRFLSFRRGDTIFVYHKLTGKREDLWAGSIDKHFGHFPKDAVQEEQIFTTMEKIVETQKSDFFCMDEFGYPIDSSHLDSDNENGEETQNKESETTPHTDDTNAERTSPSAGVSTESPVPAQEAEGTSTDPVGNKNAGDAAAGIQEEAREAPAAQNEQGGSAPSSWLGSSVKGWLGLAKEEESGNLAEGEKKDERQETQAEASLTSSVTGWLGLGGEGKSEDAVRSREEDRETADSYASTMTGWFGFGGEGEKIHFKEKDQDEERKNDGEQEPAAKFRSRRISLDLEGSQLYKEEKKEVGTLDWLGNGLSSTLGFGRINQESGHELTTEKEAKETTQEEDEQPASSSWFDMGIGDILDFRKDTNEVDESTRSGFKETEEDKTLPAGSENVETSQSQSAQTEEVRTETSNESKVEETPEDKNAPLEIDVLTQSDVNLGPDFSSVDLNPQSVGELEEEKTDAFEETVDILNLIDNTEESTDTSVKPGAGGDDHEAEGNNAETDVPHREKATTQSQVGDGAKESSEKTPPVLSSGTPEERNEQIPSEDDTLTEQSVETSVDHSDSLAMIGNNTETKIHEIGQEREVHPVDGSSNKYENASEENTRTFSTSESITQMENNADRDSVSPHMQQGATQSDGDAHKLKETVVIPENGLQQTENETTGFEKDMHGLQSATGSETETGTEEVVESKGEETQGEVEDLKEEEKHEELKEVEQLKHLEKHQEVKEKQEEKEDEVEDLKEEEEEGKEEEVEEKKQGQIEELKEAEKQEEKQVEEQEVEEEKQKEKEDEVREEEVEERKHEELEVIKPLGKQKEVEEEKQDVVKDSREEERQLDVKEIKEDEKEEKGEELMEEIADLKKEEAVEALNEAENRDEIKEIKEERKQEEVEALMEGEKQEEVNELKKEESQQIEELKEEKQEVEELKEEENREELKEVEEEWEKEKEEVEQEQVQSSHFEVQEENTDKPESASNEKETQDDNSLESVFTETENLQMEEEKRAEVGEVKHETKEEEAEEKQEAVNVEGERRDKEKEEEKRSGGKADEGKEELDEKKNSEADITGNEDNSANGISDLNALGDNQIGTIKYTDNDLLQSGESDQNSLPNPILLGQTAENKEDNQLYSRDKDLPDDDNVLHHGDKTEPMMNMKHDDVGVNEDADIQMKDNDHNTVGTEFRAEGGMKSVSSSDPVGSPAVISEHPAGSSLLSDGHSEGRAETESRGAFGLLKNAFTFFRQTKESPDLDSNTGKTGEAQDSLTPEQELDSTSDSSHVYTQDLHTDAPISLSQQQLQPSTAFIQTSPPSPSQALSHPSSLSPNTGSPVQTKDLSKHYKNFLAYMSEDETTLLMELFGRHKLQFLDYILGSPETMTDDPDNDESILLDIERLLHYHRETLLAPSMRLMDAPQADKENTRTLIALQKLEMLLARVREAFNTGKSDISNTNHQAGASCVGESCSNPSSDEKESSKMGDSSAGLDDNSLRDEWMGVEKETDGQMRGATGKGKVTEEEKSGEKKIRSEGDGVSHPHIQPGSLQQKEGVMKQIWDFVHQIAEDSTTQVHAAKKLLIWLTVQVVSSLPDDIRPGPDLYGVPWEPVILSSLVGLVTMLLFTCRCYSSVKSRMYQSKERWMAEQVAQLLDEKCKVLETLSKCQQEYDELESSLKDSGVLAQTQKTEHLEGRAIQLEHAKGELERDLEQLKDQLYQQREHRIAQEKRIAVLEESMKTFEEETQDLQSQHEQAETTLKVYNMNSDRLQKNLETAGEENALLQESNAQLRQQVEGWAERVSELEAEISRCEVAHSTMLQDVANKDERIMSLTDRLLGMKAWDSDLEEEEGEEGGEKETSNGRAEENGRGDRMDTQGHLQKVQKLIYAAKLNADLKSVDEDKDRVFAKLSDEVRAKEDLEMSIRELENEKLSLHSEAEHYSDQVQKLQQKLQIMTEMYQENELKLHRLLTVEEKERLQKEEKLNKADRNIALAMEELNNYRKRAEEMEEELEKTKQSYHTQISAHEKKAHNNWLAARAAERDLADIRRENALFRQKLTDTQFKLDALDKDPYALDSLARPLPFRAERSPYGLSPLGRPASETRAFLSPPTLMDGPSRLSPRVPRGPVEPPGGHGEMERSGGPHSDSGSNSPTWERDRRGPPPGPPGPLGPPGYMFTEPGGPMYRRPPPPPGGLGPLPPPGSFPPGPLHPRGLPPGPPHPADMADISHRENSLGPGEQERRESGPGDRRTPPEADPRMGGAPPMGPMDGPFPRRTPYGPPPPDYYPPRGPGGPPMMPMWAPPPPGMMFPPRFPHGGPPLAPSSHSHHPPPMRPPLPDGLPPASMGPLPPQQSLPSPPHSQSPDEHTISPEDAI